MIDKEKEAEILRLYHAEHWRVGTIAAELGLHHTVVRRVIAQTVQSIKALASKPRMSDKFVPFINEILEKHPRLTASRLFGMCTARGYEGKISQFRSVISELRKPKQKEAFFRLKTALPGEQAQVDWAHFGQLECGKAKRPLMAFVVALSHSRAVFLHFFLSQSLSNFLYGHKLAFEWFGGIPRICLYDNLKSVVIERSGIVVRFNQNFSAFAGHYRIEPRPVAVARGNEKGRVERAIRYIRTNFFAGRKFTDIDELNAQARIWCETVSLERQWVDSPTKTVREVFFDEKKLLMPLPENPFPCEEQRQVAVGKTPYVRFDLNDYSVPSTHVQKSVIVRASLDTVRVVDGLNIIAQHKRSYDRGILIEDTSHLEELKKIKTQDRGARNADVLTSLVPSAKKLLQAAAERNFALPRTIHLLTNLLHTYGAAALEPAVLEAVQRNTPHPHAVQNILERKRQAAGNNTPKMPLPLSEDDPRLKNTTAVIPHSLSAYDNLFKDKKNDNNNY